MDFIEKDITKLLKLTIKLFITMFAISEKAVFGCSGYNDVYILL